MVQNIAPQAQSGYGYPQPTFPVMPPPIASLRDPTADDTGYGIGQFWVNTIAGTWFGLAKNSAGVATWLSLGGNTNLAIATLTSAGDITSTAGNILASAGNITSSAGNIVATLGDIIAVDGNIALGTAGTELAIAEGVNGTMGQVTLVDGTAAIPIVSVDANSRVFLTRASLNLSPALGFLTADTSVPGTLTINSLDDTGALVATDVSIVNYLCIEAL